MTQAQHPLERRASMLAGRIQGRISDLNSAMQAANGRIPFHTQLSKGNALDWWAQHRYDAQGAQVLQTLDPLNILKLDQALGQYTSQQEQMGVPQESTPMAPPDQGGFFGG